jgi:hypothetical protein
VKTLLRLLGIGLTFAALFTLSWYLFVREGPRPPAEKKEVPTAKPKMLEELLIGTWEIVEQDPPLPAHLTATTELTKDGKDILRVIGRKGPHPPYLGVYEVKGDTVRFDHPATEDTPFTTWIAKVEIVTEDRLVLTSVDPAASTKRAVYQRVNGQ